MKAKDIATFIMRNWYIVIIAVAVILGIFSTNISQTLGFDTDMMLIFIVILAYVIFLFRKKKSSVIHHPVNAKEKLLKDERYKALIEMLNEQSETVRLDGINRLLAFAQEHNNNDADDVFYILCSHIYDRTTDRNYKTEHADRPAKEIQVILDSLFKKDIFNDCFANLSSACLRGADLTGADLRDVNLGEADLSNACMKNVNLYSVYCEKINLQGANLDGSYLHASFMGGANLTGATLDNTNTTSAVFYGANLTGATFTNATLRRVDFEKANLKNASLYGADIKEANFKSVESFDREEAEKQMCCNIEHAIDLPPKRWL